MDFTEQDKAEEWFNNSEHGKGRIAGFVPILMAEYAEHYHQSKVKNLGLFSVVCSTLSDKEAAQMLVNCPFEKSGWCKTELGCRFKLENCDAKGNGCELCL